MTTISASERARALPPWRDLFHDRISEAAEGITDMLLTGGGEWSTEIDMPQHLIDAATQAIQSRPQYTHERGIMPLREAIAAKLKNENRIQADPDTQIVVTSGGTEAICVAMLGLLEPGDEAIFGDPYYQPMYLPNVKLAGAEVVNVPTAEADRFRLDPDAVAAAITERTRVLVLTSPENPTGAALDRERLEALAEIAAQHDLFVVSDEMYEKFLYDGRSHLSPASLPGLADRTVTINGFSKTYGLTGYRIGYFAGPADLVAELAKIRNATTLCASEVSQRVALAALEGPQDWLNPIIAKYEHARDILVAGINDIKGMSATEPDGAIYIFANIRELGMSSMDTTLYLTREARVANRPGDYFGAAGEGYVRFNIAPNDHTAKEVVDRLAEAVAKL